MAFAPIRISVLRGDQKIGFDVYIEVAGRHILYLRQGDSFEGPRLSRLKQKKVKKMYIREEDERLYRDYMSRNIEMAYDHKSPQSLESRAQIVQGLQQSAAETMYEQSATEENYQTAKDGSERFAEFLLNEDKAIKTLLAIENTDQNFAHHGVTVASMAIEIAKRCGLREVRSLSILSLGSLLHDLGHRFSNLNVARPLTEFSPEEEKLYQGHPNEGVAQLRDLKNIDVQVGRLIAEHEERINGSGFPKRLTEKQMDPLSPFLQSAKLYDRLVTFEKAAPESVAQRLISPEFLGRFPLAHLNAIKSILHT